MADNPHLSLPFRLETHNGKQRAAVNEQDSPQERRDSALAALSFEQGSRVELPEFGVPDLSFSIGPVADVVRRVLARWCPRSLVDISEDSSLMEQFIDRVTITMGVRDDA